MDLDILVYFQSIRSEALTAIMSASTWLGSESVFIPVLCIIMWCIRKELGYRLGLTLFFSLSLNQTLKVLFSVPRPWIRWTGRITPVASAAADATGYSFPSGHTSTAATIYPTLAMRGGGTGRGRTRGNVQIEDSRCCRCLSCHAPRRNLPDLPGRPYAIRRAGVCAADTCGCRARQSGL